VYVTVARVDVHLGGDENNEGSWQTVATPNKTYNLLELTNGVREDLGLATLNTGHYTQMRLIISDTLPQSAPPEFQTNIFDQPHPHANYVIDQGTFTTDEEYLSLIHRLKVPSGTNTGLKVVNGFDINENQTTELILDFDAMRSVVIAGSKEKYMLKPTVKVLTTDAYAIVKGIVTDTAATPAALQGALVTAQTTDPAATDPKDKVILHAGTTSGEVIDNVNYKLFVEPGSYNLVATKDGYLPDCSTETLTAGEETIIPFSLAPASASEPITLTVSIQGGSPDQYATLDFRQAMACGGVSTTVTVRTVNVVADGLPFTVNLPVGDYTIVASTFGKVTQERPLSVPTAAPLVITLN
jgi:hypothetical protein